MPRYDQRAELAALRSDPDVVAAGHFASTPVRVRTGSGGWRDGFAWVSMDGLSEYGNIRVVAGRPADPAAADEVVVNESFLAERGARLGDVIDIATITWDEFGSGLSAFAEPAGTVVPMRIVRVVRTAADLTVAVDNNNALSISQATVALGPRWVERVGATSFARYRVEPGHEEAGIAALRAAFPGQVTEPTVPGAMRNLQRVSSWPALLTLIVGFLALTGFLHGLVVMVRRQRGQMAVLQALGSRRRQLGATVSWYVTALVVPALVIGVPLGVVVGRWGWGVFAANLGVPPVPVVPLVAVVAIVLAALAVVNVVTFPVAWRAAHRDLARARRTE